MAGAYLYWAGCVALATGATLAWVVGVIVLADRARLDRIRGRRFG